MTLFNSELPIACLETDPEMIAAGSQSGIISGDDYTNAFPIYVIISSKQYNDFLDNRSFIFKPIRELSYTELSNCDFDFNFFNPRRLRPPSDDDTTRSTVKIKTYQFRLMYYDQNQAPVSFLPGVNVKFWHNLNYQGCRTDTEGYGTLNNLITNKNGQLFTWSVKIVYGATYGFFGTSLIPARLTINDCYTNRSSFEYLYDGTKNAFVLGTIYRCYDLAAKNHILNGCVPQVKIRLWDDLKQFLYFGPDVAGIGAYRCVNYDLDSTYNVSVIAHEYGHFLHSNGLKDKIGASSAILYFLDDYLQDDPLTYVDYILHHPLLGVYHILWLLAVEYQLDILLDQGITYPDGRVNEVYPNDGKYVHLLEGWANFYSHVFQYTYYRNQFSNLLGQDELNVGSQTVLFYSHETNDADFTSAIGFDGTYYYFNYSFPKYREETILWDLWDKNDVEINVEGNNYSRSTTRGSLNYLLFTDSFYSNRFNWETNLQDDDIQRQEKSLDRVSVSLEKIFNMICDIRNDGTAYDYRSDITNRVLAAASDYLGITTDQAQDLIRLHSPNNPEFLTDTHAPDVSFVNIVDGQEVLSSFNVIAQYSDDWSKVSRIYIYLSNRTTSTVQNYEIFRLASQKTGICSTNLSGQSVDDYSVWLVARDLAGNQTATSPITLYIRNDVPKVTITSPVTSGRSYTNYSETVTVSGTASVTGYTITNLTIIVNNQTNIFSGSTSWSHTVTLNQRPTNNIYVYATADNGKTSQADFITVMTYTPVYVSPAGNDSNPGTIALPKLTIKAGLSLLTLYPTNINKILNIQAGAYSQYVIGITNMKNLRIVGGWNSTFTSIIGQSLIKAVDPAQNTIYIKNGSGLIISNIIITGIHNYDTAGINIYAANNTFICNSLFTNNGGSTILLNYSTNTMIIGCNFIKNYIEASAYAYKCVNTYIRNSSFINNYAIDENQGVIQFVLFENNYTLLSNIILSNNSRIDNSLSGGVYFTYMTTSNPSSTPLFVYSSLITHNDLYGIYYEKRGLTYPVYNKIITLNNVTLLNNTPDNIYGN